MILISWRSARCWACRQRLWSLGVPAAARASSCACLLGPRSRSIFRPVPAPMLTGGDGLARSRRRPRRLSRALAPSLPPLHGLSLLRARHCFGAADRRARRFAGLGLGLALLPALGFIRAYAAPPRPGALMSASSGFCHPDVPDASVSLILGARRGRRLRLASPLRWFLGIGLGVRAACGSYAGGDRVCRLAPCSGAASDCDAGAGRRCARAAPFAARGPTARSCTRCRTSLRIVPDLQGQRRTALDVRRRAAFRAGHQGAGLDWTRGDPRSPLWAVTASRRPSSLYRPA